jgi:G:T/U-mismatch repair DNA glycosylase
MKGTASDKDLEIVEPTDLDGLLRSLPQCRGVLTAGQLATKVFTDHYGIRAKGLKMGSYVEFSFEGRALRLYRMPSSSRAYPMAVGKKAAYYKKMFDELL